MIRSLATTVSACMSATLFAGGLPEPTGKPTELVLLAGQQTARIELLLEVDGQPLASLWEKAFARLLQYADQNGDGQLSEKEASKLPSAYGVRQVLWGELNPLAGSAPPFQELDKDENGQVTRKELIEWYRNAGVGEVTIGVGTAPFTNRLNEALIKSLDGDGDGKVSEKEFAQASKSLRKLDANDDELVTPGELVERVTYPGTSGANHLLPPGSKLAITSSFPILLLPAETSNTHWASEIIRRRDFDKDFKQSSKESGFAAATFVKLDANNDGKLDVAELAIWRQASPDTTWRFRLSTHPEIKSAMEGKQASLVKGLVRFEPRLDEGRMAEQIAVASKRLLMQFTDADTDRDGFVTEEEALKPKPSFMKPFLPTVDLDSDGKLSRKELTAWIELQKAFAEAHAMITILDHGVGLFEVIDADHDGALSPRELALAWDRVKATECVTDGALDTKKLPHQLLAIVSRGQPISPLGKPPRSAPAWFLAMDRNRDGDVSRREFTGPADIFEKLDMDRDGLLSAVEASKAETKK